MATADENEDQKNILIELDLFANGIDFILTGIDGLFEDSLELRFYPSPLERSLRSYKYGILHLFSGFLLLLKERLRRHLEEMIFKGSVNEVRAKLKGDRIPNTIDLDEALDRMEMGPRVTFSESELKTIRRMQDLRTNLNTINSQLTALRSGPKFQTFCP